MSAVQQKPDKLDEAFLYSETIDVTTYGRQRDRLREEMTLAKIDYHAAAVEELDVEGILLFAERILPRASDLWVQAKRGVGGPALDPQVGEARSRWLLSIGHAF